MQNVLEVVFVVLMCKYGPVNVTYFAHFFLLTVEKWVFFPAGMGGGLMEIM